MWYALTLLKKHQSPLYTLWNKRGELRTPLGMNSSKILAGLILLLRPDLSAEDAIAAAEGVLEKLDPIYDAAESADRVRVTDEQIGNRIREYLAGIPHCPTTRELLLGVKGNRDRVYRVLKTMLSLDILEIVRDGRSVGIKVKE